MLLMQQQTDFGAAGGDLYRAGDPAELMGFYWGSNTTLPQAKIHPVILSEQK